MIIPFKEESLKQVFDYYQRKKKITENRQREDKRQRMNTIYNASET